MSEAGGGSAAGAGAAGDGPIPRLNAALEGRYRIERELGEGGMATVYLADDLKHERKVALKVLKPELAAVVGGERFLAEIKTTANLNHPHILPLFDSGEAGGGPDGGRFLFFVMPYVAGDTLRDKIDREKQLSIQEAIGIATKIASALDYAHEHGVVHRDIKPGNILLSERGEPTVADFGIALAVAQAGGGRVTETGLSVGTPHYMSPEQATGDRDVDPRTDIYALGCVLYEMLIGEPPYTGSTAQAVLGKIIQGAPVSATGARGTVPPNVDAVIRKALEKLPADRFGSAREFADALADSGFRHGFGGAAPSASSRGLWNPVSIGATVLVLVLGTALAWSIRRTDPPEPVARFLSPFLPGQAPTGHMEFTPDGSALVYVGSNPDGGQQLWVRRLEDLEATPIPGSRVTPLSYIQISPDGSEVAYVQGSELEGPLIVGSLDGGPTRRLAPAAWGVHGWSSDGFVYFQHAEDQTIWRVASTGAGTPERVTELREGETAHDALRLLPDERLAVFTVYRGANESELWLIELETGDRTPLVDGVSPRYVPTGHLLWVRFTDGILMGATIDGDGELGTPAALAGPISRPQGVASYAVSNLGWLAYTIEGSEGLRLVWVDREGREEDLPLEPQPYLYPSLSPDGGRVATVLQGEDQDIWTFDLARLTRTRITFGGDNRFYPIWSPAGESIAVSTGAQNPNVVRRFAADGSGQVDTLLMDPGIQAPVSWSPDGRFLALVEADQPGGETDISILELGGQLDRLLTTDFQELSPMISPDGGWIAYASDRSGRFEIYMRPLGASSAEVVVSTNGGIEPRWSASGSELFYRTTGSMVVVDVSDRTRPGPPRVLWPDEYARDPLLLSHPNYDVHPDGERLLMIRSSAGEAATEFVVNWFQELRQRIPDR